MRIIQPAVTRAEVDRALATLDLLPRRSTRKLIALLRVDIDPSDFWPCDEDGIPIQPPLSWVPEEARTAAVTK